VLTAAALAVVLAQPGCTVIDPFDFRFGDAGTALDGAPAADLRDHDLPLPDLSAPDGGPDLPRITPGGIGDSCQAGVAGTCENGLTCVTSINGKTFPYGFCTRACNPASLNPCGGAVNCQKVENMDICLPACGPLLAKQCRTADDYRCCDGSNPTIGPGSCAPLDTDFCK
jgi:hypothetical protein